VPTAAPVEAEVLDRVDQLPSRWAGHAGTVAVALPVPGKIIRAADVTGPDEPAG
jgi:hypothetical protein